MLTLQQSHRVFLGEGLIETLYFKNGVIHFLEEHWQRMRQSALALAIPFSYDLETWHNLLYTALTNRQIAEGGLRCLLLAGKADRGLGAVSQYADLDIQVFTYTRNHTQMLRLCSAPWRRDNRNPVYQHKSIQYLEHIQAIRQALSQGCDDALFWDMNNHALETTTANIIAWDGECFYTPAKSQAVIPGVFLDALHKKLGRLNYKLIHGALSKTLLLGMSSLWVCNSLRGLCPVTCLDGQSIAFDERTHGMLIQLLPTYL